jgi:beta-glucanase (GH16 family)
MDRDLGDGSAKGIPGWGNQELQIYTEGNALVNTDGILELEAKRVIEEGLSGEAYYGSTEWTSARLVTKGKALFQYGEIVIRAKVPAGVGIWPAFWMLGEKIDDEGWPLAGEIDIMEWVGREPHEALGTLHGPGYFGSRGCGGKLVAAQPFSDDWHEFGIYWKPDQISWHVDGDIYFISTPQSVKPNDWVFNQPFSMILNMAVGGNLGGPLAPDLPDSVKLLVEWIRVYEFEGYGQVF